MVKRRILAMCLLVTVLISGMATSAFALTDIPQGRVGDSINKLVGLGVIKGYEDDTFKPDNNITRAEFVAIINRVLGMGDFTSAQASEAPFNDVPATHWASGNIKYAVNQKLISGYGDGFFGPEDNVTYEQAFKIIFNAMGYSYIAESIGTYPDNYISLAAQNNVTKGLEIKFVDNATRGNICSILYEAMQIETYENINIGGTPEYGKTGKTLLSELLRMQKSMFYEGVVIENKVTSLTGASSIEDGFVKIKKKDETIGTYRVGETKAEELIGQKVEFQVKQDENDSFETITKIDPNDNKFFEINSKDLLQAVVNGDSYKIEYEVKEKTESVITSKNPAVIYNGKAISTPSKADLEIKNGTMQLIDNNKTGKYSVIKIESTYSFLVDKTSAGSNSIFIKNETLQGQNRIVLDPQKDDFYFSIKDMFGATLKLSDLKQDDVITVRSDKESKNVDIIVSRTTIQGKVTEYSSEDEVVKIGDKQYFIAKNDSNRAMMIPDLKKSGTFYLDANGLIVHFEEGETLIETVGYVDKKSVQDQGGASTMYLKILRGGIAKKELDKEEKPFYTTGNKDLQSYKLSDNIRLNGTKTSVQNLDAALNIGSVISYGVNKEGLISSIDTLAPEFTKTKALFNPDLASFGGGFYIDDKTAMFGIPTKKDPSDPDPVEEDYFVTLKLDAGTTVEVEGYEIDPKTKIAKFAVMKTQMKADVAGTITSDADILIVTGSSEKYENEETYYLLEGLQKGQQVSLKVKNDSKAYTQASSLNKGDVVFFSKNSQGLIDNVEFVQSLCPKPEYFIKDQRIQREKIFGRLLSVVRNELMPTTNRQQSFFEINVAQNEDDTQIKATATIETKDMPPIYELNSVTGKVKVIVIEDLLSVGEAGFGNYNDATEIFICKRDTEYKGIIVVK